MRVPNELNPFHPVNPRFWQRVVPLVSMTMTQPKGNTIMAKGQLQIKGDILIPFEPTITELCNAWFLGLVDKDNLSDFLDLMEQE